MKKPHGLIQYAHKRHIAEKEFAPAETDIAHNTYNSTSIVLRIYFVSIHATAFSYEGGVIVFAFVTHDLICGNY